jgi:hypothetical protein
VSRLNRNGCPLCAGTGVQFGPEYTLIEVGEYCQKFNEITGLSLPILKIYRSIGLSVHLRKRKHTDCLKFLDDIPCIIQNPDFVGVNPNEIGDTIEIVKVLDKNVLVGIKLDKNGDYYYVSTMFAVQESKLQRRLHSGRLKKFIDKHDDFSV